MGLRLVAVRILGAAFGVGFLASGLAAQNATLEFRARGADSVVVATARSIAASWRENEHGDRLIVSRVQLEVSETLKGASTRTLWLDVDGGTLDGYTLRVSGLHMPEVGERGVYLLDRAANDVHVPHLRGLGILPLDEQDVVRGSNVHLNEIRTRVRAQAQ
jgi:hypothetical protein